MVYLIRLWYFPSMLLSYCLTLKHLETHQCILSTVATDALVLKPISYPKKYCHWSRWTKGDGSLFVCFPLMPQAQWINIWYVPWELCISYYKIMVFPIYNVTFILVNSWTCENAWVHTQHCGYWWPGAKAPGHQYPWCRPVIQRSIVIDLGG